MSTLWLLVIFYAGSGVAVVQTPYASEARCLVAKAAVERAKSPVAAAICIPN